MTEPNNSFQPYILTGRFYGIENQVLKYLKNSTNSNENKHKHLHKLIMNAQQKYQEEKNKELNKIRGNFIIQNYPNNASITTENLEKEFGKLEKEFRKLGNNNNKNLENKLRKLEINMSGGKSKKKNNKARNS